MPTNAKKIRIGGVSHDIEDTAARTSIGTLSSLKTTAKTNLVSAVNEVFDSVDGLDETYAKQDGYYQDMTVGDAEQLVSSIVVNDSVPYKFRTSSGSADIGNRAYMDKIVGGTVAWNQLVMNGNFASSQNWEAINATLTVSGNEASAVARSQWGRIQNRSFSAISGHKYLATASVKGTTNHYIDLSAGGSANKYLTTENAWQQMTVIANATSSAFGYIAFGDRSASDFTTFNVKNVMLFDLTQMFGSTVADYIYSLEQSTAGAGVAFFRSLFPNSYYAYNAGELISVDGLQSHDTVGFNAWDGTYTAGAFISSNNGQASGQNQSYGYTDYVPVIGGQSYYFKIHGLNSTGYGAAWYDSNKVFISGTPFTLQTSAFVGIVTAPSNARYMRSTVVVAEVPETCINLSNSGARNGEYEPYKKHSYPLDSSLTLRGIPKLDSSNQLYWDGDEYAPDGTVTRRYGVITIDGTTRTVQLNGESDGNTLAYYAVTGRAFTNNVITDKFATVPANSGHIATAYEVTIRLNGEGIEFKIPSSVAGTTRESLNSWFASNPTTVVYELATPTTETADAYQQIQNVDDYGTEEFVSTSIVPVGHVTRYPANLRDKLQHLPDLAASNGTYVILQSGSQMTLAPLTTPTELPAAPSANGTYTLKATVSNGAVTYSWGA